jgi:hypothetical protein
LWGRRSTLWKRSQQKLLGIRTATITNNAMSNDELDRLVERMRLALTEDGVVGIIAHSYSPPIVAIACDSAVDAERPKMGMELNVKESRVEIQPHDLTTILRYF